MLHQVRLITPVLAVVGFAAPAVAQDNCGLDPQGKLLVTRQLTVQEAARCGGEVVTRFTAREDQPLAPPPTSAFRLAVNCDNLNATALRATAIAFLNSKATGALRRLWEKVKNEERVFSLTVMVSRKSGNGEWRKLATKPIDVISYSPAPTSFDGVDYICKELLQLDSGTTLRSQDHLKLEFKLAVSAAPRGPDFSVAIPGTSAVIPDVVVTGVFTVIVPLSIPIKLAATIAKGLLSTEQGRSLIGRKSKEPPIAHELHPQHQGLYVGANAVIYKVPNFVGF